MSDAGAQLDERLLRRTDTLASDVALIASEAATVPSDSALVSGSTCVTSPTSTPAIRTGELGRRL